MNNSQFSFMGYLNYVNNKHDLLSRCTENTDNEIEVCVSNLTFFNNLIEILIVIIILTLLLRIIVNKISLNKVEVYVFFIYHCLFSIFFSFYTISRFRVDPVSNYLWSLTNPDDYLPGKDFIEFLVHLFSYHLSLSYFSVTLIFGFTGLIGILFLYKILIKLTKNRHNYYYYFGFIFLLFPSFHFWNSGIGKDSLILMALSITLYWMFFQKNINFSIIISFFLILMIRPHIALILSPFLFLILLSSENTNKITKYFVTIISLIFMYITLPMMLKYVGININSYSELFSNNIINQITTIISHRETLNYSETAGYNLKNLSIYQKIFNFLFGPMPYEAKSTFQLYVSLENILLLLIFLIILFYNLVSGQVLLKYNNIILLTYIVLFLIIFSLNTGNYGISNRQKWMILPYILFFLFFLSKNNVIKK